MMVSLLMACCITSAIQQVAPNLAGQAQTAVVTQAEGLGQNLAKTLLPSMDVSTLEAQAQTMVATAVAGAGQQIEGTPEAPIPNSGSNSPTGVPSDFPVAPDATNLKVLATGAQAQINYQTKLSLTEMIGYCTAFFLVQGWQERSELTSESATTFNIVFEKASNPSDIVIQGVKSGDMTNVNVRYEVVK